MKWRRKRLGKGGPRVPLFCIDGADGVVFASGGLGGQGTVLRARAGKWRSVGIDRGHGLRGIHVHALDDIWVVGEYGTVMHSDDGGDTWRKLRTDTGACLYRVARHPEIEDLLFVTADGGVVLRSGDHGASWEELDTGWRHQIFDLCFDPYSGYVFAVGACGGILHTPDAGDTWEIHETGVGTHLCTMHLEESGSGWAVGDAGVLLGTEDHGQTWERLPLELGGEDAEGITRGGDGKLYLVAGGGTILCSADGCVWQRLESGTRAHLRDVWANPDGGLVVVGDNGTVLVSGRAR
jgi:photosystem II stability/assembly factor-like uncharacterized protein